MGVEKTIKLLLDDPYLIPSPTNSRARKQYHKISLDNSQVWTETPVPQHPSPPSAIDHLSEIEVPALIIIGELDHPDMHQIANLLEMRIEKGQKILVSQAGHMVSMERPQEVERIIINFLGKR